MPFEYDLNLHHLELFHAVVQEGSVSAAAIRLGTSQPSVSRQIRELEERTGLELLERLPRGVRPTEAGAVLFAHARDLFAVRDQARRSLRDRVELSEGLVSVGASSTVGTYLLPSLLSEFRRLHPGPRLRIEMGNTAEVEQLLREGRIELGLVEGGASQEFVHGVFGHDELVPVCSPSFFSGRKAPRALSAFCQHPMVLRESGAGSRHLVERILEEHGLKPQVVACLDSAEAILRFVEAGLGVSLLPKIVVAESIGRGNLVGIPIRDASFELRFEWIRVDGRPVSPATKAFLSTVSNARPSPRRRSGRGASGTPTTGRGLLPAR
jgi:DNA-binding transcriptional LysR family regulator